MFDDFVDNNVPVIILVVENLCAPVVTILSGARLLASEDKLLGV